MILIAESGCTVVESQGHLGNAGSDESERRNLDAFGQAINERAKVRFAYRDGLGDDTVRTVRPLAMHFWGKVWTLAAWCELRSDFRTFRVDRAEGAETTGETFPREPGRSLEDYLARVTR